MYRCTECKAIYENLPEFCDCGNDTFEELPEEAEVVEEYEDIEPPKRKLTRAELRELEEEKSDKRKAIITLGISLFLSLLIIVCPPYIKKKPTAASQTAATSAYSKLPSVDAYWDNTLPSYARSNDKYLNLPVLNEHFGAISPTLRNYLQKIGGEFNQKWDSDTVKGKGEARVAFVIDPDGRLEYKQLISKSNNESLDDSVLLMLSKVNGFDIPPDDYKGEKIILSLKADNGITKIQFPTK